MSRSSPWRTSWRGSPGAVPQRRKPFDANAVSVAAWGIVRWERKRRSCKRGLREGDDEMA